MLTHQETRAIVCGKCGSRFKTTSARNLHVREKHESNAHVCETCGLEFTHQRALDKNMLCHSDVMHYGCTLCGYRCRRKQDLDDCCWFPEQHELHEYLANFVCVGADADSQGDNKQMRGV